MILDNLIVFTALLLVTGFILKFIVKYIDSGEKSVQKKHRKSHYNIGK